MSRSERFGPMQTHRHLRVAELIRRALADVLSRGIPNEPDLEGTSITVGEVRMSPDLRRATVFVLPLGGANAEEAVAILNVRSPDIRRLLNKTVTLKRSPALTFVYDRLFDQMEDMRLLFDREEIRRDLAPAEPSTDH